MKKSLYIAVAFLCLFINVQAQKKAIDKVVAVVGSNIILLSELNQQYGFYLNQGNPADDRIKCVYLQQMLIQFTVHLIFFHNNRIDFGLLL